jgi:DNA modification methylase
MKKEKINEIDMGNWKEYEDILTDSLWIIMKRDNTGNNKGDYHGNFIPQIPNQLLKRYTKKGEWVLDGFIGSGTTLIECQKLGRNGIGIDIDNEILTIAKDRTLAEYGNSTFEFLNEDSRYVDLTHVLAKNAIDSVQLVILHPPYWDIIKFNELQGNLAASKSLDDFLADFAAVVKNCCRYLAMGRFVCIVIGDIYKKGEWIPLNSYVIQMMLEMKFQLKSIVVKNIGETKGKQNQKSIWRYRALLGGFYVFKHEYILIFKKITKG